MTTMRKRSERLGPLHLVGRRTWAVVVCVLLAACGKPPASAPPPPKVTVVQPVEREVTEWDEYTARLEAVASVEVRPRVSGYLQSIHFQDGAMVKTGDLLFQIDPRPYEALLRHAEADVALAKSRLTLAQKNLARAADLIRSNAISQEEADIRESGVRQAEASLDEAEASVDSAKLDVEFTRITAPVSGRIGRKLVTEGNLITGGVGTQGTLLTTIVSLDPIYAYFEADERSYLKYNRLALTGERPSSRDYHNPVWIGLDGEEGFPRQGAMDFVDNQLDRGTGTIIGRALVPNPDLTLTPGLFARLRLPGSGTFRAVLIPDEAVGTDQSQKFVFIVDDASIVQYRTVQLGSLIDGLRVVRDGLTVNDWVIVGGVQRVRPDMMVDAQREAIATPAPTSAIVPPAGPPP
jgi:RND family efflux transporter MFP subunit